MKVNSRTLVSVWLVTVLLAGANASSPAALDLTAADLVAVLRARSESVQNGVADFHRYIHVPAKEGAVLRKTRRGPTGEVIEKLETRDQPEGHYSTRHLLTFSGADLVRNESYTMTDTDVGSYDLFDVTIDWGDQRRHTPTDTKQYIMLNKGRPGRLSYEPIGNAGVLVPEMEFALKLKGSDSIRVEKMTVEGESMFRVTFAYSREGARGLEVEAVIDPARHFLVRRHSQWIPSRDAPVFERTATYDDPVQNAEGIWYPSLVNDSTFAFPSVGGEVTRTKQKSVEFNILSYETNLTDLDMEALFDRDLPQGRKVLDYILDPENGYIYESSQEGMLGAFYSTVAASNAQGGAEGSSAVSGGADTVLSNERASSPSASAPSARRDGGTSMADDAAFWFKYLMLLVTFALMTTLVISRRNRKR